MDDKELEQLLNTKGPNKPKRIKNTRNRGSSKFVPEIERRKRREVVSRLLASGASNDTIYEIMGRQINEDKTPGFNMSEVAVRSLIQEVYKEWQEEDSERSSQNKSAAQRRILNHITRAKQRNAWTAVANLEKVLMHIQGTSEPIEVNLGFDVRVTDAVHRVLAEEDPKRIREMIEGERLKLLSESNEEDDLDLVTVLSNGNKVYK